MRGGPSYGDHPDTARYKKEIEDLMNVRGIGEKSFLNLKPLVTVTAPKSAS